MLLDKIKQLPLKFYLVLGGLVLTLIATIWYYLNSTGAYYNDLSPIVVQASIISLILLIVIGAYFFKPYKSEILDAISFILVIILGFILFKTLLIRVDSIAIILFSDLEDGNQVARSALNGFIILWLLYFTSFTLMIVTGFMKTQEQE